MPNGHRHIRAGCACCGKWLRWVLQTPEAVALADAGETCDIAHLGRFVREETPR